MAGERFQALQNALLQAFPSQDALRELLLRMDLRLAVITTGRALAIMVLDVIEHCDAHGRLDELVGAACALRPRNTGLDQVAQQYWPQVQCPAAPPQSAPPVDHTYKAALSESEWHHLIQFIREKKCTPVIGPGACHGTFPPNVALAAEWAKRFQYPFADHADLARVAQYLALTEYRLLPHEQIQRRNHALAAPDFSCADEPHALLADLDLPLYLTTNYDDFMERALASRRRSATRAFPYWNQILREQAPSDALPSDAAASPLVYHLFGHQDVPESMVLTEDDHLDFLSSVAADPKLLPPAIKRALSGTSLLFIGFGVLDWGFRVLVRTLVTAVTAPNKRLGVAVQLRPEGLSDSQRVQVEKYLEGFLNDSRHVHFRVFWGDTREFTRTLRLRWEDQDRHAA